MTNVPRKGFVLACLFVVLWGRPAAPQHPAQYVCLTLDRVEDRAVVTEQGAWRYRPGDDPGWADPSLDDADWEVVDPVMADGGYPAGGWQGIGWFRLHVDVDSTLWGRPVGLTFRQTGASEIYLDGRRLFVLGRVGRTIQDEKTQYQSLRPPLPISFDAGRHHVLAVRYSNHGQERTKRFPDTPAGFIATEYTAPTGDSNCLWRLRASTSHSVTPLRDPADTRKSPSTVNARSCTRSSTVRN